MKKIFKIIVVIIMCNTTFAQTVRELKFFYTDNWTYNEINMERRYYKDIHNYFTPFLGQWKYENGNQTFIVTLWKETKHAYPNADEPHYFSDEIFGHYDMYQNYGQANQMLIYTSRINIGQSITPWPTVIFANSTVSNRLSGHLFDVMTEPPTSIYMPLRGDFTLIINNGTSPITAQWVVKKQYEIWGAGRNTNLVIPTNVTLTKM